LAHSNHPVDVCSRQDGAWCQALEQKGFIIYQKFIAK